MKLKNYLFFNTFVIFIFMFLTHFLYNLLPIDIIATFFPVNESIFEHMKMIFSTYLLVGFINYFILKKLNIKVNNYITSVLLASLTCIIIFLIIWLPFYYNVGDNLIVTLIFLFIAIFISQILNYYMLTNKNNKNLNYLSLIIIVIISTILGYLTFNPIYNDFFLDPIQLKYGKDIYLIK